MAVRRTRESDPADRAFVELLRRHLPGDARRIAVLAVPRQQVLVDRIRACRPAAHVQVFDARQHARLRHAALTAGGPWDAIVDASGLRNRAVARLLASFYQLRPGGVMVIRDALDLERHKKLATLLAGDGELPFDTDDARLRDTIGSFVSDGSHVVLVTKGVDRLLAKMDERQMDEILLLRPDSGDRVVEVIPGEGFTSRCSLRENVNVPRGHQPASYVAPPISLREYTDVIVAPGQLVTKAGLVLPDSYRHNERKRLTSRFLDEVAPLFAQLPRRVDDLPLLPGTYFHLDNEVRGHFGHLITEQVSRMWAWPLAQELAPGVKAVMGINKGREISAWEHRMYAAGGIEPEDIVFLRGPVRVERLLSATPMLSHPEYIHPRIVETWNRIGDQLAKDRTIEGTPERIFISRRLNKRACRNQPEVEALFTEQGFEVVFPEDYDLSDQVTLFRGAEVIGGFAGSGMFTMCFAPTPKRLVTVGSERYVARNEYLIASVLGHSIDAVHCRPEDPDGFQSPFVFDHEREGPFLAEVFSSL